MNDNKKIKTLAKDTGLFAISNFGSKILVFLLTPLYTSILTTEEYGIADLITTTIGFIYPILTLAIADATIRYALDKETDKKKVLNTLKDVLAPAEDYYVYMLMCGDGSFYTGSTNDVRKRFAKHSAGLGCKYTKTHQPVQLIYVENCYSKRAALQREYAIKQLSKPQKIKLLDSSANIIACFQADQSN